MTSFREFPAHVRAAFSRSQDYKTTFESPAGQRVLADLMAFTHMGQDVFVPGEPDTTNVAIGMRRVGLRIASFMRFDERAAARIAEKQSEIDHGEFS